MLNRLKGVLGSLERHDVRYILIGGIAAILHGVPRVTLDADLLIQADPENASKLLLALREAGLGTAYMIEAGELLSQDITIFKDKIRVDVMTTAPGIDFESAWQHRERPSFEDQPFNLLSKSDLIAAKKASGRPKDLEDVRLLEPR